MFTQRIFIQKKFNKKFPRTYLQPTPLSEMGAFNYLSICDIVHRDLKLENILIAKNPQDINDNLYIKVTDFGLSIIKTGSGYEDMLHGCCGTMIYMAPEIITSRSYSQQCDIWAIGVIMYSLLRGHYPFYSLNEQELISTICKGEPSYSDFNNVSAEATHLISKMLMKNPALRITAAEVILHPWVAGKTMTHESDQPENVLDMMRLWRSEMMLPVGDECDWVSSARAAGSSNEIGASSAVAETPASTDQTSVDASSKPVTESDASGACAPRRQSMRLPVKNIRFDRTSHGGEFRASPGGATPGRRVVKAVGNIEDPRTRRRGRVSPPQASTSSGLPMRTENRSATRPHPSNKPQASSARDKAKKKTPAK